MDIYNKPSPQEYLAHYGVLGMKWGVRKDRYKDYYDKDVTLKKGSKLQTVTGGKAADLNRDYTYVSRTSTDNDFYSSYMARGLQVLRKQASVYKNELTLTDNIKIPSQEKAVKAFLDIYHADPEGTTRAIAKSMSARERIAGMGKLKIKMIERQERKSEKEIYKTFRRQAKQGEEFLKGEAFTVFNSTLVKVENPLRDKYFNILLEQGFGGVRDTNDLNDGYTEDPLIIFNPSSSLAVTGTKQLTEKDIKLAYARYDYATQEKNK